MGAEVLEALNASNVLKADSRIFIEYVKSEERLEDLSVLGLEKAKNYGDKLLYTYIVKSVGSDT
jgi:hypothetical protein